MRVSRRPGRPGVSAESVQFYWSMTEHFRRDPGPWWMEFSEWTVRRPWLSPGHRLLLRVDLYAGKHRSTGRFAMGTRVGVRAGPGVRLSRAAAAEIAALAVRLQERQFRLRPPSTYYPLAAWKRVTPRSFAIERAFLSALTASDGGLRGPRSPESMEEFLASFRGSLSGSWHPHLAAWEHRKPLHISGRPATAFLKIHIAPSNLAGTVLGAASSITVWPPWSGSGSYPAWLRRARGPLREQFQAAGHEMTWYRGPKGRGLMVSSMRHDLATLPEVVRERRVMEAMRLGDES